MLVMRIFAHSPLHKRPENVLDIVFWLVAGLFITGFLNEATTMVTWFAFWTAIIMLIGVSLVIRAIVLATFR
jgi:hypothetical protein